MRLCILDHSTMQGTICTLEEFARDNADDPEIVADAACLAPGFGVTVGGGAAPTFTISRWPGKE